MALLNIFEDFVEALNTHNRNKVPLTVNSMYVLDDQRQRDKMAAEFHNHIRKEVELCQERAEHFIVCDCQSVAIMDRWVLKNAALEEKKRHYEELLQKDERAQRGVFHPAHVLPGGAVKGAEASDAEKARAGTGKDICRLLASGVLF